VEATLSIIMQLVEELLPDISNSSVVDAILKALIQLVPIVVEEAQAAIPAVKNIIAALSDNPATTAEQLATLKALDAQVDAAFDSTADAYLAAHPAPSA
jgi:hypothetical protein